MTFFFNTPAKAGIEMLMEIAKTYTLKIITIEISHMNPKAPDLCGFHIASEQYTLHRGDIFLCFCNFQSSRHAFIDQKAFQN